MKSNLCPTHILMVGALRILSRVGALQFHTDKPMQVHSDNFEPAHVGPYYWPMARGRPGQYSTSLFKGPRNFTESLAWNWSDPRGKYTSVLLGGPLIDDELNIYIAADDKIMKFDTDGNVIWTHMVDTYRVPALMDGALFGSSIAGEVFSLRMDSGSKIWSVNVSENIGADISAIGAYDGVVIACTHGKKMGGESRVSSFNASNGALLWEFFPDGQLWNFMPLFSENNSLVFQDQLGSVYHLNVKEGSLLWKASYGEPGPESAWTDGMAMLGPNGTVYGVHMNGPVSKLSPNVSGNLRAYSLAAGTLLWQQNFSYPPNSQPVVAQLGRGDGRSTHLSVVMPIGAQAIFPFNNPFHHYLSSIHAFNAATGSPEWSWAPAPWEKNHVASDKKRFQEWKKGRTSKGLCLPNPWASPTVDVAGALYAGYQDGKIYRIRDSDGDGKIQSETEVSSFNAGAAFGHPGASIAPGMLAIASCDTLFVFKD